MKKKVLAIVLSLAMIISMLPTAAFASGFGDMPNDWSTKALENAVNNGLLIGDNGKIMPNDNLTRAQMATVVNRVFGATEKASISSYTDVAANAWYYDEMAKAVQMKTFVGSGDKLNPDMNITREEAFLVLARAFKLSGAAASALDKFSDKALVSSWAKDGVASLVSAGYVLGSDGQLNPKQNITRAEFAQMMDNLLKNYIKTAGTYTTDFTGNVMVNVPDVTLKNIKITGDLIIGDGVGNGDVTLDGITVTGRTIIRGGGVNSIKIIGNSSLQSIIITRVDGEVRVYAEDGTQIGEVIVDGSDDVTIEGNFGTVTITAPDVTVTVTSATIVSVNLDGDNSQIIVGANSTINTVTAEAENATVTALAGSEIEDIVINSDGTTINGTGDVGTVEANADNITVTTPGTSVTAATGTTDVTAGTTPVLPGTTETVDSAIGGGGGGGGSSTVAVSTINNADVAISSGSVVFGYTFTATSGSVTYGQAKAAPYYLNVASSTVTLTDGTNSSIAYVEDLEIADNGTATYADFAAIQSKFLGLDFVPTEVLIHLVGASSVNSGADEWTKDVTISLDGEEIALLAVVAAEGSYAQANLNIAQSLVTSLPDGAIKTALQARIDAVQDIIDATEAVIVAENSPTQGNVDTAQGMVTSLPDGVAKTALQARIDVVQDIIDAETLAAAKETAHGALTTALGTYTESDYTAENWTVLTDFKTDGDAAIDAATDLAGVSSAQTTATEGMAGVETIAETLAAAKVTAHGALTTALATYTESDYTAPNWATLTGFKTDGDAAIDAATDLAGVSSAQTTATEGMAGVETIAETLAAAKVTAKGVLTTALADYTEADYTAENWTVLTDFKTDGDTAIDAATDLAGVSSAQTTAIEGMAGVETIAETLAAAKVTAKGALTTALGTYTESDYTAENWTVLTDFKTDGDTAIDAATDLAGVSSAQTTATEGMAGVETIAETLAAAKTAIEGATYTDLAVDDPNDAAQQLAAVQAVVDSVKGDTTALVTADGANFSVAISFSGANDTVIITTATFVLNAVTPVGDLLAAKAGSDFTAVLYKKIDGNIYYNQANSNGVWGLETLIGTSTEGSMAVDSTGKAHVVYTTAGKIGYRMYDGSDWTAEVLIESNNAGACSKPDIAVDSNGKAHITYTDTKGSTGDPYDSDDIMYATNSTGDFVKTLIYTGRKEYIDNYGSFTGQSAEYYKKGSMIAVDSSNNYYILSHHNSWSRFDTDIYNSYDIVIYSNLGTGSIVISSTDNFYDLTSNGSKVIALYKQTSFKTSELTVSDTTINFASTVNITGTTVNTVETDGTDLVVGGISTNLQSHYNGISKIYDGIVVKSGSKVSVVNMGGTFYEFYSDNSDSNVKIQEISAPVYVTATSNGIATATGTTTISLGEAITGLTAEDIVVKKGVATLVKDTDYTLSADLTGTTFDITFLAAAALDNTSEITVVMTKEDYVINNGVAIAVANNIAPPAPALINGLTFYDDPSNATNTAFLLGEPSVEGNTFVYKISEDANAVPTPNIGDDLSAWEGVWSGDSITAVNGTHIGVAEVDGSMLAVRFSDATAVTLAPLTGSLSITAGTPPTFGTELTVDSGTLSPSTNLTYTWYRSVDSSPGDDTLLGTGTTYTPVEADVANYLIIVATSTDSTGSRTLAMGASVAKAAGPEAPIEAITGTFPVAATQIDLAGFAPSATGLEAAVAINGTDYDVYADLTVDGSGNATILGLTGVTTSTTVRIRVKETATILAGADKEITVTAALTYTISTGNPGIRATEDFGAPLGVASTYSATGYRSLYTITKTGTGDITNLDAVLSGNNPAAFIVYTEDNWGNYWTSTLNDTTPGTYLGLSPAENLVAGTYTAILTITADNGVSYSYNLWFKVVN